MDNSQKVNLPAFLNARLDEDERRAQDAIAVGHRGYFDGPRALREVEAKQAILARHYMDSDDYIDGDGIERAAFICHECDNFGRSDNWPCPTIRFIAAVYSDHPDYRQEWAS